MGTQSEFLLGVRDILSHFKEDELPEWTLVLPDQGYTVENADNIAKGLDQVANDVLMICALGKSSFDFLNSTQSYYVTDYVTQKTIQMKNWIKELLFDWHVYGWLIDGQWLIGNFHA